MGMDMDMDMDMNMYMYADMWIRVYWRAPADAEGDIAQTAVVFVIVATWAVWD